MRWGFWPGADGRPDTRTQLGARPRGGSGRRARVSGGRKAGFGFHGSKWVGGGGGGLPIAPEGAKLPGAKTLCVYGKDDEDAVCPDLPANDGVQKVKLPGDHPFNGDYDRLAEVILKGGA